MHRLAGKVGIVTGGGSGIGRASALRLAEEGAAVGVADIDRDAAAAVAREIEARGGKALSLAVDVSDADAVKGMVARTVEAFGGLDVLHNNAALVSLETLSADDDVVAFDAGVFERSFAVNVLGPLLGCKYAIPRLLERGGGSIVNTVSIAGLSATLTRPIYGMTKAALGSLTRSVARQYGKRGIRCNAVAPGPILSPAYETNVPPEIHAADERACLTPELGKPEDVAAAVVFLASDDAAHVTGQTLVVDGGRLAHFR